MCQNEWNALARRNPTNLFKSNKIVMLYTFRMYKFHMYKFHICKLRIGYTPALRSVGMTGRQVAVG